jgi:hypothetical protein
LVSPWAIVLVRIRKLKPRSETQSAPDDAVYVDTIEISTKTRIKRAETIKKEAAYGNP